MATPNRDQEHGTMKLFGRPIKRADSTGAATEGTTKSAEDKPISFCSKNRCFNGTQWVSSQSGAMESDAKPGEVKTETAGLIEEEELKKELKKPENVLPCPRCNSMKTRFYYFNNYDPNQQRHYCRDCQRYWTAGGTLKDLPVGAGKHKDRPCPRRQAKKPCDHGNASKGDDSGATHQQQSLPVQPPRVLESLERPGLEENEGVTKSGSEVSSRKSKVPAVLNEKEKKRSLLGSVYNKEEKSCADSSATSDGSENWMPENTATKKLNVSLGKDSGVKEAHPHTQSQSAGPSLVVPQSPGWNMASNQASSTQSIHVLESGMASTFSVPLPTMMPAPGLSAPAALPFTPVPPSWNCILLWPNGTWSYSSWPASNGISLPSPPPHKTLQEEENKGNNIVVPKVRRITNPEEAAKSTFMSSLGIIIKPNEKSSFKPFQSEVQESCKAPESPRAQQANPAAVSDSQSFQEKK